MSGSGLPDTRSDLFSDHFLSWIWPKWWKVPDIYTADRIPNIFNRNLVQCVLFAKMGVVHKWKGCIGVKRHLLDFWHKIWRFTSTLAQTSQQLQHVVNIICAWQSVAVLHNMIKAACMHCYVTYTQLGAEIDDRLSFVLDLCMLTKFFLWKYFQNYATIIFIPSFRNCCSMYIIAWMYIVAKSAALRSICPYIKNMDQL